MEETPARGYAKPNHTQTPNTFFDESLRQIKTLAELKIVLAVIRQTFGWQKDADAISVSQLQKMTGLTRESVTIGVQAAIEHGFIARRPFKNTFLYSLVIVGSSDQSDIPTSRAIRPKTVGKTDQKIVGNSDPQKKVVKEKKETIAGYAALFDKHYQRIGDVPDAKAQGEAIKWILARHTAEKAMACYDAQLRESWRKGHVSWLTVKSRIGEFRFNGRSYVEEEYSRALSAEQLQERLRA